MKTYLLGGIKAIAVYDIAFNCFNCLTSAYKQNKSNYCK